MSDNTMGCLWSSFFLFIIVVIIGSVVQAINATNRFLVAHPHVVEAIIVTMVVVPGASLIVALIVASNRETKQREAKQAKQRAAQDHRKLLLRREHRIRTLPASGPWRFKLPVNGKEIIPPHKLDRDRVYRIEISGTYTTSADALYCADNLGNFTCKHGKKGLRLNGKPRASFPHRIVVEERHTHRYAFQIDGTGDYLSLAFPAGVDAVLDVVVTVEPEGTPTLRSAAYKARVRKKEEQQRQRVAELLCQCETLRNWGDPIFIRKIAVVEQKQLLTDRHTIEKEQRRLLEDSTVLDMVERKRPGSLARLTGRFEALLEAERVVAGRARMHETIESRNEALRRKVREDALAEQAVLDEALIQDKAQRELLRAAGLEDDQINAILNPVDEVVEDALDKTTRKEDNGDANITALG